MPESKSVARSSTTQATGLPPEQSLDLTLGNVTLRDNFIDSSVSLQTLQNTLSGIRSNVYLKKDSTVNADVVECLLSLNLIENWMNNDILLDEVTDHLSQLSVKHGIDIAEVTLIAISHAMTLPQATDPAARARLLQVIKHIEDIQDGKQLFDDYIEHGLLPNQINNECISQIQTLFGEAAVALQQRFEENECKAIIDDASSCVTYRNQVIIDELTMSDDNDEPNSLYWQAVCEKIEVSLNNLIAQNQSTKDNADETRSIQQIKYENDNLRHCARFFAKQTLIECHYNTIYNVKLFAYLEHQHVCLLNQPSDQFDLQHFSRIVNGFKSLITDYKLSDKITNSVQSVSDKMQRYQRRTPTKIFIPLSSNHIDVSVRSLLGSMSGQDHTIKVTEQAYEPIRVLSFRTLLMGRTLQMRSQGRVFIDLVKQYVGKLNQIEVDLSDKINRLGHQKSILKQKIGDLKREINLIDYDTDDSDDRPQEYHSLCTELQKCNAQLKKINSKHDRATKRLQRISEIIKINYDINPELLGIQFCHGTNSATLHNLALTDYRLMPTGRLLKLGVIPTQGEQWEGTMASTGVNSCKLSGTTLIGAKRTIVYSKRYHSNYQHILNQLKGLTSRYLNDAKALEMPSNDLLNIWSFARIIRSIRSIAQNKHLPELEQATIAVKRLVNAIEQYRESKEYLSCYSETHVNEYRDLSLALQSALTADIQAPNTVDYLNDEIIPIVLASRTFLQKHYDDHESHAHRSLRLGDDLQYLFTEEEHIDACEAWLTKHGFAESVQVYSFRDLRAAGSIEMLIAHSVYRLHPHDLLDKVKAQETKKERLKSQKSLNDAKRSVNNTANSSTNPSEPRQTASQIDVASQQLVQGLKALSFLTAHNSAVQPSTMDNVATTPQSPPRSMI